MEVMFIRKMLFDILCMAADLAMILALFLGAAITVAWMWRFVLVITMSGVLFSATGCDSDLYDCQEGACPTGKCPVDQQCSDTQPIEEQNPYRTVPPCDIPRELRCDNYAGGSCMHASIISILRWQRKYDVADAWRKSYSGAAGVQTIVEVSDRLGVDYAFTTTGDEAFLEWCSRTRRGAAIYYGANHAQSFLGYDADNNAVVLDNNNTGVLKRIPKDQFLRSWRSVGGGAITPVYSPSTPRPWL